MKQEIITQEQKEHITELKNQIEALKEEIKEKKDKDRYDEYNDMLDDCYPIIKIGNCTFSPSNVLKNCDEVAYDCGYNEYIDGNDDYAVDKLKTDLEVLEEELQDLENDK